MRFVKALLSLALVADAAVASSWFSKAAYNKWHETELERWLSDHDIPYPTPADRKDLQKVVEKNWNNYAIAPYQNWDAKELAAYLKLKGLETKDTAKASKETLLSQVQGAWYSTEDKTQTAWSKVSDWILDTWTDSQLKAFCDKHNIPVPQPRTRDTLLQKARSSYESVAEKANEVSAYPGNWLYESWTESDLKEWLDTHGFPAPQPTTRDKMIAQVRRNSHLAYLRMQDQLNSATASARSTYQSLTDTIINAWSETELKNFCDKNGINVPQGTKVNELRALVRKQRASMVGDTVSGTAVSAFGAATSSVSSTYTKATDTASKAAQDAFDAAIGTWSESRLKNYLDARGVPVPQASKTDELRALVRKNAHKAATGWNAWTFDDLSYDTLKDYLVKTGDKNAKKAANKAGATRDDLVKAANSAYASASKAGGTQFASATSYLSTATQAAKDNVFDTWSESELKSYLDSYGVPVPQGTKVNELRAYARKQATYYKYGTTSPTGTLVAKVGESINIVFEWVKTQLNIGSDVAKKQAAEAKQKLKDEL